MRWSTYEKLDWKHYEAEMEKLVGMRERLEEFEGKLG
jgi:hypothetical protein